MKAVICDRDIEYSDKIKNELVQNFTDFSVVCVSNTFALVTYIYDQIKGDIDLIFIRVNDADDEAISVMKDVQEYFPHISVIFISEKTDCAQQIFELRPSYFLLKPIRRDKLYNSVNRVLGEYADRKNRMLSLSYKGQVIKLSFDSINYMESSGRKIIIYSQGDYREVNMTMADVMKQLPQNFVQCHRSYIVNVDKIVQIIGEEIELSNGNIIPLSRSHIKEVKKVFTKSM